MTQRVELILKDADANLRKQCNEKAREIYGDDLPEVVVKRLEHELTVLESKGYSSRFLIAADLADNAKEYGFRVRTRGMIGSALASFLCGISSVNPLPAHYYCPECHRFEQYEEDGYQVMGYDLPHKECPKCGAGIRTDGANVPFEVLVGLEENKEPDIILNVASEIRSILAEHLKEKYGKDSVFRAGVKRQLEDGSINRGIHPGGVFITPTGFDINEITELREELSNDDFNMKVTEEDYSKVWRTMPKYDLLIMPELDMLKLLEERTGVLADSIQMNDNNVLEVFLEDGFSFLPRKIFDDGQTFEKQAISLVKPRCFSDLARLSAAIHGTGAWTNNGDSLLREGKTISDIITSRDDIMLYLMELGMDKQNAYEIMDAVRKGKGITEEMRNIMCNAGVPDWCIDSCNKIQYLFPKAHAVEYMLIYWKLAYYRLHFPEVYLNLINEGVEFNDAKDM